MTDDRQNLRARREIVVAYIEVLGRLGELVDLCSAVGGDTEELRSTVMEEFGISTIAADAVVSMQVRRFTPDERRKLSEELADIDLQLERLTDT